MLLIDFKKTLNFNQRAVFVKEAGSGHFMNFSKNL